MEKTHKDLLQEMCRLKPQIPMTTHHKPTAPRGRTIRETVRLCDDCHDFIVRKRSKDELAKKLRALDRFEKASRNGKLPLAGKTRKIPTPSGKEVVGWVNVYRLLTGDLINGTMRPTVEICSEVSKNYCEAIKGTRIACIPLTDSMLKRWSTK